MIHSVVVFPTKDAARASLAQIRIQAARRRGRDATPEAERGVVILSDPRRTSAVFREGPVLVRLSLPADAGEAGLMSYVAKAREKGAGGR